MHLENDAHSKATKLNTRGSRFGGYNYFDWATVMPPKGGPVFKREGDGSPTSHRKSQGAKKPHKGKKGNIESTEDKLEVVEVSIDVSSGHLGLTLITHPLGVMVAEADPIDLASEAGLRSGDVIIAVSGERMTTHEQAAAIMFNNSTGTSIFKLEYYSAKTATKFLLKRRSMTKLVSVDPTKGHLGLTISGHPLGLLLLDVNPCDLAHEAGMRSGGVVVTINGQAILDHRYAVDIIQQATDLIRITYYDAEAAAIELVTTGTCNFASFQHGSLSSYTSHAERPPSTPPLQLSYKQQQQQQQQAGDTRTLSSTTAGSGQSLHAHPASPAATRVAAANAADARMSATVAKAEAEQRASQADEAPTELAAAEAEVAAAEAAAAEAVAAAAADMAVEAAAVEAATAQAEAAAAAAQLAAMDLADTAAVAEVQVEPPADVTPPPARLSAAPTDDLVEV